MRLEMGYFDVKRVEFGPRTIFADGVLTINKDEFVRHLSLDSKISSIDIAVVHPGERVRIANILEMTEPRIKEAGDHYYPGTLGPMYRAGDGRTNALRGAAILRWAPSRALTGVWSIWLELGRGSRPIQRLSTYAFLLSLPPALDLLIIAVRSNTPRSRHPCT
jgi:hypothetical protein